MPQVAPTQRNAGFVLALLLLAASIVVGSIFTVWRMRSDALRQGFVSAETYVRNFEEHLTQVLQVIEITASSLTPGAEELATPALLDRQLSSLLRPLPYIRSISLLDEHGRIVASSTSANAGTVVEPGDFFPSTDLSAELLRVGPPWNGRDIAGAVPATHDTPIPPDGVSFVPVLRGTGNPDLPTVLVTINPDYFVNHWTQLLEPETGHVQWLRYDDVLLASSDPRDVLGRKGQAGAVGELVSEHEQGQLTQTLSRDDETLTAYRASSRFPAMVAVHIDRDGVIAAWSHQARRVAILVAPLVAALCIAAFVLHRRHRRYLAQQRELEHERQLAASVFSSSSVGLLISDPSGKIVAVNPAFERDTGYTSKEVIGLTPRILNSGLNPPERYADLWSTITQGRAWRGELQNRNKNGSTYWEAVVISPVLNGQGEITHFVASMENVTAKKLHEIELQQAKEAAEAANVAKSRFLATMSHELRTPMNGILGMAQLQLMPETSEDERRNYATVILESGNTLLALLNDILDLSKVEAGKMTLEPVTFAPQALISEAVSLFAEPIQAKGLELTSAWVGPDQTTYVADTTRLRQMLSNLISNAAKFTSKGFVHVEGCEAARLDDGTAILEFSVTDSGIGISQAQQENLFTPFTQADSSTTRKFGGSGLGLSILRNLAQLMGGEVGIQSKEGEGSRFWFRVRSNIAHAIEIGHGRVSNIVVAEPSKDGHTAAPHRILIVEDIATNRLVIEGMLRKRGLTTQSVENGEQALAAISAGGVFDLVLMDCQMPVMDGLEATQAIRRWEEEHQLTQTPIIALTAGAFEAEREQCLAIGMDDFLTKPVKASELYAAIDKWGNRK